MSDLKTSIIIDLSGNLQTKGRQYTQTLQRMGSRGAASMRLLSRGVSMAGRGLDRLGNRYTALITGAAGIGAVRQVANLEQRFTRLGIQSNKSAEEIDRLKQKIFETAKAPDIRVDPSQITSAIEEIVEKTGDLEFARENIRNIALALQATGAEGTAIGGIMAEFEKMGMGAKEAFEALEILTVQGKEGAFTLQNLAALGPRVVTAYTAMGRQGVPAIREMGAALQVIRQGTGSAEMAATAFEALLRTLGDADKVKILKAGGIQIFEPGSTTVMRSLPAIMDEIIQKTKGSKVVLSKVFDAEAIRAFNAAAGEFQKNGRVESLQRFYNVQADGNAITTDAARAARTFNAAMQNLYTVWQQFADSQLAEPIKRLTDALDGLEPGTVERWLKIGKNIALVGGGAVIAGKAGKTGVGIFQMGSKILGKGAGASGALGGMAGALPVYVVNDHMSLLNDGSGFGAGPGTGTGVGRKAAKAAKGGRAVGALKTAGTVFGMVSSLALINEFFNHAKNVIDTNVASYDAAALASTMNKYARINETYMREYKQSKERLEQMQMRGELKITIDKKGFVTVDRMTGQNLDLDVDAGRTMLGN